MTRIQVHYDLTRPVDDNLLDQISRLHAVYGIHRIGLGPALDKITVDYDATRLTPLEVETVLRKAGLPIALHV